MFSSLSFEKKKLKRIFQINSKNTRFIRQERIYSLGDFFSLGKTQWSLYIFFLFNRKSNRHEYILEYSLKIFTYLQNFFRTQFPLNFSKNLWIRKRTSVLETEYTGSPNGAKWTAIKFYLKCNINLFFYNITILYFPFTTKNNA